MVRPNFSRSSARFWMTTRWMVTSRAVVGSSAISRSGCNATARAMITRCFIPPESSWAYIRATAGSSPTCVKQFGHLGRQLLLVHVGQVELHHVEELVLHLHDRVQRVHRPLRADRPGGSNGPSVIDARRP